MVRSAQLARRKRSQRGFTLMEMIIVVSIIVILLSIAIPSYQRSIIQARETVLRNNLWAMRQSIAAFTNDKQRAPQSLDELVSSGYLGRIPEDPITKRTDTWVVVQEDAVYSVDQTQPGISNVTSGAPGSTLDGQPYSSL